MRTLRILHVVPSVSARSGGPAVSVVGLSRALAVRGHEVTIASTDLATPPQGKEHAVITSDELASMADLDVRIFGTRFPARLAHSPAMGDYLRVHVTSFDVVHIHSLFLFPQYSAYRAASSSNVPYVVAPCGALDPYLRRRSRLKKLVVDALWQRRMLDRAAVLQYKTAEEAALVADLNLRAPPRIVPNGVSFPAPARAADTLNAATTGLGSTNGHSRTILFVGRLAEKKGIPLLLQAVARLSRDYDIRLVIAGPDDERMVPGLRKLAEECGIGGRVRFAGSIYGDEKQAALRACDVWVLPSFSENFAQAALEALAEGCPVVLSSAVNIAGEAAAARASVVTEPTVDGVAAGIRSVLELTPDALAGLRVRATEFARRYDWARVAEMAEEMYLDAARSPVASSPTGRWLDR